MLLLKTLLLSTSSINTFKHTDDQKKRKKIIVGVIGAIVLYGMIMAYSISICIGYGQYGIIGDAPLMCALVISTLSFFFAIFKTNGYLFNFKEYDMLMSLPFEAKTVAGCKFLYMYIKSLPWHISISIAMMIGYGIYAYPSMITYPVWLVLTFFVPIIPMLVASFFGFIIARISAGFRKTNAVQTVLTFIFVLFCFSLRFFIEDMFKEDKVEDTLTQISGVSDSAARFYLPIGWFNGAVTELSALDILLLIGVGVALFAAIFLVVGNSYRNINSALKSHAASKRYKMTAQKMRSVVHAIAFKEFKRMLGSTTYMVNGILGLVLSVIFSVFALVLGFDKIISFITKDAPLTAEMLQPAIPLIIYFFIGMFATTACTPSLEGKSYWIVQSLPIETKTLYKGKMLYNIYLTVPIMLFSTVCICISAKVSLLNSILYVILGLLLCAFSTSWGCVCGVKHIKLEWENDVEVIKQGAAVVIYMLPNMFVTSGLCVLVVYLGMHFEHTLITGVMILIASVLTILSYSRVMKLANK
ncbi:MAG: hypothetical protein IKF64_09220 [Eubacterium sp.]|nr:hypothetical protein [Eubacterium sp.]